MRACVFLCLLTSLNVGGGCASSRQMRPSARWASIGSLLSAERFAEALPLLLEIKSEKEQIGETHDAEYAEALKHAGFCLIRIGRSVDGCDMLAAWVDLCADETGVCSHQTLVARQTAANFLVGKGDIAMAGRFLDPAMQCFSTDRPPRDEVEALLCVDLASLEWLRGNLSSAEEYMSIAYTELHDAWSTDDKRLLNLDEQLRMIRGAKGPSGGPRL